MVSTIVEIPLAYQPGSSNTSGYGNLQQQKFHWLISRKTWKALSLPIYNSRNSIGLLAKSGHNSFIQRSTIVEIPLAYQPPASSALRTTNLQQQKFHWLISLGEVDVPPLRIYNSRNSIGLLAVSDGEERIFYLQQQKFHWLISQLLATGQSLLSTIVEIPLAYQPWQFYATKAKIYNSRNSIGLLAPTKNLN